MTSTESDVNVEKVELREPRKGKYRTDDDNRKDRFDLDEILSNEIGQFGRHQIITLLLAAFPIIFCAFSSGEYIFTTGRIPSRCLIPQCDGADPEFAPSWLLNAVNGTSLESFDNCQRFANASAQDDPPPNTCPASLFNRSSLTDCEKYVYENSFTVVYDFNLACNEWRRSQIGSFRMFGTLLVLPITGYISDRWGRRVALVINVFNTGWLGLVRSFVNSYEWFLALELIGASIGAGTYCSCYILVTELVGPDWRVVAGASLSSLHSLGQVLLGVIAWSVRPWRTLTRVFSAPELLVISYFWLMSESVRWLMTKGRYGETEEILKKVAKTNNKKLSKKSLEALWAATKEERNKTKEAEPWLVLLVLKSKPVLLRCCVAPIWWIIATLVLYGISINAVNLSGNPYLNYIYVAAIEIPGEWTAILLLDRIGRKPLLISAYFLCCACQFAFVFMPDGLNSLSLAMYLIGKYASAIVMTSLYVYTVELFPTKYRHSLFAFCSMLGRIGSITAPLTPALAQEVWGPFPQVLFGSAALLSGLLVFLTPETLGTKLPDTMHEAEQLSWKKNKPGTSLNQHNIFNNKLHH